MKKKQMNKQIIHICQLIMSVFFKIGYGEVVRNLIF